METEVSLDNLTVLARWRSLTPYQTKYKPFSDVYAACPYLNKD